MPNEKTDKELEALRKENIRLKAELSDALIRPSMEHWLSLQNEIVTKDELLNSVYDFLHVYPWLYDFEKHKVIGLSHSSNIWSSKLPESKDSMDNFLARVPEQERKVFLNYINAPEKYPELEGKFRFHGDDDKFHYYNYQVKSIWDDSGQKVVKAVGLIREITEQQNIEDELNQKRQLLNNAYDLTNSSAWSYDFENDLLTPSEQVKRIWNPPIKGVKQALLKRIHPEDRGSIISALENPEKASATDFSCRITGDDGNMYYLISRCMIDFDDNGKPLVVRGITWDITEKKLHEKQSQQTETNLRFYFENIGFGAWEYNVSKKEIFFAEPILKYTSINHDCGIVKREEFLKEVHYLDADRVEKSFGKLLSGENQIYDCIFRLKDKKQKYVWVLLRGIPIYDNRSRLYKVIGSIEDLSESRRFNVIKERLNFMQRIADALPIPVYYKDMKGRYVGCNDAFSNFIKETGTTRDSLIGLTAQDLHENNNIPIGGQIANDEKEFLASGKDSFERTYILEKLNGSKWVIVNKKSVLYDSEDNPKYLVGGLLDITELKLTEERLRQATERLNTTLDAMSEMVICYDKDLNLQWANRAARMTLGENDGNFKKCNWKSIWKNSKNNDSDVVPVKRILNGEEEFSMAKVEMKDGKIFRVRAYPVYSEDHAINGVVEMSLDITEQEAIKAKSELHKEQLRLADKMKSLGVLISGVAHEINNPNNFISINSALMERMWNDSKPLIRAKLKKDPGFKLGNIAGHKIENSVDDLILGIKDGSERIGRIIGSLKGYIRNVPADVNQTFNLNDALENAIFLLKNQIMKSTNKFEVEQLFESLPVRGIQQKIEQVIINVLQNACQALESKKQAIKVKTYYDDPNNFAVIRIEDSGTGIDPRNLAYIADPFFTTKREEGGTGLGLSISSSILKEHKGRFEFNSKLGKGTVVEIMLPLASETKPN